MDTITDKFCQQLSYGFGKYGLVSGQFSFSDLIDAAKNPESVDKNRARWFTASPAPVRRANESVAYLATVLPLDFDTQDKRLSLEALSALLKGIVGDAITLVYSTSSATPESPRWRAVMPLAAGIDAATYTALQAAISATLEGQGIAVDGSMARFTQVSYAPNVPPQFRDASGVPFFYQTALFGSSLLDWEQPDLGVDVKRRITIGAAIKEAKANTSGSGDIYEFNKAHDIDQVLAECGYVEQVNPYGRGTNKWQSPYQRSGSYATEVYPDGRWYSLSASDAKAKKGNHKLGLACKGGGICGDALDLVAFYKFGGDTSAALAEFQQKRKIEFDQMVVRLGAKIAKMAEAAGVSIAEGYDYHKPETIDPETVEKAVELSDRIRTRITDALDGLCVEFDIDADRIAHIIRTSFLSPAKGKVHFMNRDGDLVAFAEAKAWKYLTQTFGNPVDLDPVLDALPDMEPKDRSELEKRLRGICVEVVMDHVLLYRQRDVIAWRVDMFAAEPFFKLREFDAQITLPHRPYPVGQFDPQVIDDFRAHWPEVDRVLGFIAAARFAIDRKKAFLWWQASSDFGKGLFMSQLKALGIVVETSVKEVEAVMEGKPIGLSADNFKRAIVLHIDEFKSVKSELKQLQNEIALSPKNQLRQSVELFAKVFTSAEDVASLTTSFGVEDQYVNRMSQITGTGSIDDRPLFAANSVAYGESLRGWIAQSLNDLIDHYTKMGPQASAHQATEDLKEFHATYNIGLTYGRVSTGLEDIGQAFRKFILSEDERRAHVEPDLFKDQKGCWCLRNARKHLGHYLNDTLDQSEVYTFLRKKKDILVAASVDGKGENTIRTTHDRFKGVRLSDYSKIGALGG